MTKKPTKRKQRQILNQAIHLLEMDRISDRIRKSWDRQYPLWRQSPNLLKIYVDQRLLEDFYIEELEEALRKIK